MKLQLVVDSGKNFKRKSSGMWLKVLDNGTVVTAEAVLTYHMSVDDILADDWEIEKDQPTDLNLTDGHTIFGAFKLDDPDLIVTFFMDFGYSILDFEATEKDIDKILTFLYNNTEIGKSRITPF